MRLLGKPRTRHRPRAPQPDPVGQAACLSETPVAFAGAGRVLTETAIAFARGKCGFSGCCRLATVLLVSMVAVQGRALVMVVSRWPVSVVVEVSLVASSPRGCVLCAKKFAPRGLVVGVSAKKFALHAQNTPKSAFLRLQGELFRGWGVGGGVLGELFRACRPATATSPGPPLPPAQPATACRPHGQALRCLRRPSCRRRWGFCSIRSWLPACRRRVASLMMPIPPFGGREFVAWRTRVRVSGLTCAISPMRVEVVT